MSVAGDNSPAPVPKASSSSDSHTYLSRACGVRTSVMVEWDIKTVRMPGVGRRSSHCLRVTERDGIVGPVADESAQIAEYGFLSIT